MKTTGRNDPCPCGSGKKYKKCCLNKTAGPSLELYYERLSRAYDNLVDRLMSYGKGVFGPEAVAVAMDEFLVWPETEEDVDEVDYKRLFPTFVPWFLFNWEYDPLETEIELPGPQGRTVAELYAEHRALRLDTLERLLIEAVNRKPFSFYDVVSVDKGKAVQLKDLFTGKAVHVLERSASQVLQPGDVIFGNAATVDGVGMLIAAGMTFFPPDRKPAIIELRKRLQSGNRVIDDEVLHDWDAEIRQLYFDLEREMMAGPMLCNTDGHRLEFHRLIYEIPSAEKAFEKLHDLCHSRTREELEEDADRDESGRVIGLEFPWDRLEFKGVRGVPNTVLGRIRLDDRRLIAEVNSAERAEMLRREIDRRLGPNARFMADEIQSLKALLHKESAGPSSEDASRKHKEVMEQHPEARALIEEMLCTHWEHWIDEPIPALHGKTPREAVRTADGREAVEALLQNVERSPGADPFTAELNRREARRVRRLLGLSP
ncbi:Protein of unknown function [Desulfacinum infernum DSM 9756]|uniref:Antitoxin Xre/MbcA/ParS-like toxin-binding domain-containing protein n=1 Tax=Desulfacinum infernum DSM 9756 TaxID=1121391 RepID=A0A1M4UC43_9BACT|nr:SEC-C metal-binding domain-containing protein [Desulfacinum infernum]SHE54431.1 Protein of unknown function [Desulfacinum infernum DSM 9756]